MPATNSTRPGKRRRVDPAFAGLVATTLVLVSIGLIMILSASSVEAYKQYGSSFLYFYKQIVGIVAGCAAMFCLSRIDYRILGKLAGPMLLLSTAMLIAVLVPGVSVTRGGSSRWLELGPLTFQPSELAKLTLILFAAHILDRRGKSVSDPRRMAMPILPAAAITAVLVVAQPDLGTAIICLGVTFMVLYLGGARGAHLGILSSAGAFTVAGLALSEGYRRARLFSFLNPWADPLNTGYHVIQGQIALGSGGWFGLGLGASRQKWSYVPNAHTDFIYAILGEELGLLGTLAVLALFVVLLSFGVRVARKAPDRFGFLLAGGITGWIGLQALVNMGAVSGLLPITGVPLPLISFGSSSLIFTMAAIGILLSIAKRAKV